MVPPVQLNSLLTDTLIVQNLFQIGGMQTRKLFVSSRFFLMGGKAEDRSLKLYR
jgi:hypothetical protein